MPSYSDFVRDDYTRPIRGALVQLFAIDGTTLIDSTFTSADGQFTVTGPDAKCILQVSYGGASERSTVLVGNPPEYTGPPGPADNTYTTYAELLASDPLRLTARLAPDATETEAAGNFSYLNGEWVRQAATGIVSSVRPTVEKGLTDIFDRGAGTSGAMEKTFSRAGVVGNNSTDDFQAMQDALSEIERNVRFEDYASNTPYLGAGELVWPQGVFLSSDTLVLTRSLRIRGEGNAEYSSGARIQQQTPGKDLFRMEPIAQGASLSMSNLVLRANGGGGTGGSLIHITAATGKCNTIRIDGCLFGTPQSYAVKLDSSDDVLLSRNLYDVSATQALSLGSASGTVTRFTSENEKFFSVAGSCFELYNVRGCRISNPHVYGNEDSNGNPSTVGGRTGYFINGGNQTSPTKIHGLSVTGGIFQAVKKLFELGNGSTADAVVRDFLFANNTGRFLGRVTEDTEADYALMALFGTINGATITGNKFTGSAGSKPFLDDSAAVVFGGCVTDNTATNTGGGGPMLMLSNTGGAIANNVASPASAPLLSSGFSQNSVGHRWTTTGSAIAPGAVAAGAAVEITRPVIGALAGDSAKVDPAGGAALAPDGIDVTVYVTAGVLHIRYFNTTAASITVPAHDISARVYR